MKIYTQTGDQGKTGLLSGERVSKSHARIDAYGEVDELNSVIGLLIAALSPAQEDASMQLRRIQSDLFHAGAWLSAASGSEPIENLSPIGPAHSRRIEALIDAMDADLPELRSFILPGGTLPAAWSHLARAVCRRAERRVVEVIEHDGDDDLTDVLVFLNRLSDYFFVLARWINHRAGVAETTWPSSR